MSRIRILLVDDDELVREPLDLLLQLKGFDVTASGDVAEALKLISSNVYDVLLTDLHMPGAGDGLTVVSAMRHANPKTVTMLLSGFPEMDTASQAILLQVDQILVKPMKINALVKAINLQLARGTPQVRAIETVATILERTSELTIKDWFEHIRKDDRVMTIPLTYEERTCHLHQVLRDLIHRLRASHPIGSKELISTAAVEHGANRHKQGYSSAMMVEESRILQVSIFHTLQNNLAGIDFSILLTEVMTIADEIDSQLSQAMTGYATESAREGLPA